MSQDLFDLLRAVLSRLVEVERRVAGTEFRGRVKDIDADKHQVRVVIGADPEGEEVLSPWLPVGQTAGQLKIHDMPSVGQQVRVTSASGDIEQGAVEPMHWSEGYDPPSDDPDVKVLTFPGVRIDLEESSLKVTVGDTIWHLTPDGLHLVAGHIVNEGDELSHNGINVGHDHKHRDVEPGAGISGIPLPI